MSKFTSIENIGKQNLINRLKTGKSFFHSETLNASDDDAAVTRLSDFESMLSTSKTFVESIDFDLTTHPLHHLGYKIVMASISNIVAMNAKPDHIQVSLAVSAVFSVEMLETLYEGIHYACDVAQCEWTGGDFVSTRGPMIISTHVTAKADADKIIYRSGAQEEDAICISGDLGSAMAGLRVLLREKKIFEDKALSSFTPDLSDYEYVVKRQLLPNIRFDLLEIFEQNKWYPTSMIDLSDGVLHDLNALITQSNVGAKIFQAALPIAHETRAVADEMETDVDKYALYGGEDYELLFTMPKEWIEPMFKITQDFAVIGTIIPQDDGLLMQQADGELLTIKLDS